MGKGSGEVRQDPATQADLDRYAEAERQLAQMQALALLCTTIRQRGPPPHDERQYNGAARCLSTINRVANRWLTAL